MNTLCTEDGIETVCLFITNCCPWLKAVEWVLTGCIKSFQFFTVMLFVSLWCYMPLQKWLGHTWPWLSFISMESPPASLVSSGSFAEVLINRLIMYRRKHCSETRGEYHGLSLSLLNILNPFWLLQSAFCLTSWHIHTFYPTSGGFKVIWKDDLKPFILLIFPDGLNLKSICPKHVTFVLIVDWNSFLNYFFS